MVRRALCIVAIAAFCASAQTVNLQGVVSGPTGTPISGAILTLVRQNMKDTTGADGKFSFIGTSVKRLPAIVPQSDDISLKNSVLEFTLHTQSSVKLAVFDLKGNLLRQESKTSADAGTYRFDLIKNRLAAKVLVIRAAIGSSEVTFRYMPFDGVRSAVSRGNVVSAGAAGDGLTAVAAVVDTLKVTATGFQDKSVSLTTLENQQQNITLDTLAAGKAWPTANPAAVGPFEVEADKNVGPLAGRVDDPVYGQQMRFNVYRPKNIKTSGYLHPILIWANGFMDNPEPNGKCILDRNKNWCGQYLPILQHLASHGFVVIASLSTATADGNPLPTIAGLDWIIKQNNDSVDSKYYRCLDTSKIGQFGHSYGGMSTCKSAADPRYKALATICGTSAITGLHTPIMFYCGGADSTVKCRDVKSVFSTVKNQPAFFIDELRSDHGWWVYQGPNGVSLSASAAWFRVHLMNDTANRKYFYGSTCTFCSDSRVIVERNSLMQQ